MLDIRKEKEHYLMRIQKKREEMCFNGKKYGLCAKETIKSSQDLDYLLNEYYQLFQKHTYTKTSPPRKLFWFLYKQPKISS
ncbi:Spo0E family sporulation regulatory protein-aspartic acid phosphatase [Bacillus sp. N9]